MAQLKDTIINGNLVINDKPFFDWLYPIGCLYWSSKSTDPSELFAGTTWKQITDKFIFAQGNKAVDTEGGNENIKLTVEQLPSHNHYYKPGGSVSSSFTGTRTTTESGGSHIHKLRGAESNTYWSNCRTVGDTSIENRLGVATVSRDNKWYSEKYVYSDPAGVNFMSEGNSSHSHYYTAAGSVSSSFTGTRTTTEATGSATDINIMPPYVVKYCWERTA